MSAGRWLIALASFSLFVAAPARAQNGELVFAVTEGVTYQATPKEIRDKFEPLAEALGKALKRGVRVVLVPAYNDARAGFAKQEFDLAFVHPAHVALAEVKAGRYKSVAWTAGYTEYTVSMLAKTDAGVKDVRDLRGKTVVTPDPDSITAAMVRAMFRTANLNADEVRVRTTRYQDAVPFYIDNGFADVGATAASSVVKEWTDKGGKVVVRSRSVPIKLILGSTRLPAEERERIRETLLALPQSDPGRRVLASVGYKGFVAPDEEVERSVIAWLGL